MYVGVRPTQSSNMGEVKLNMTGSMLQLEPPSFNFDCSRVYVADNLLKPDKSTSNCEVLFRIAFIGSVVSRGTDGRRACGESETEICPDHRSRTDDCDRGRDPSCVGTQRGQHDAVDTVDAIDAVEPYRRLVGRQLRLECQSRQRFGLGVSHPERREPEGG